MSRAARGGFTTIEMLIAMAVATTCLAAMLSLLITGQQIARRQPEWTEQQQRARLAMAALGQELALAGAGLDRGPMAGPLVRRFPPIQRSPDDGLTVWYASGRGGQASLASPLAADALTADIAADGSCPSGAPACAFAPDTAAIIFDAAGCHDAVRIDDVTTTLVVLRSRHRGCAYPSGSAIAEGQIRTYRVDPASRQLLRRDEATGVSLPVLDNVRSMAIEILDQGRRVRVALSFAATLLQMPDLAIVFDTAPPNVQERW